MDQTTVIKRTAPHPSRVAIFRALKLGDLLCAVPALRAFRKSWPAAEISLVGLPWAEAFARRFGAYIDGFIEFPGWPGLPEREPLLSQIPDFLAAMQRRQFDLAVQLHGSGRYVNELVTLFGAKHTAGFFLPGDHCADSVYFVRWPGRGLEARRLLALPQHLGIGGSNAALEFPLSENDFAEVAALDQMQQLSPGTYAVVHPGASVSNRRWPAERFAAVSDALAESGLVVALTGERGEAALVRQVIGRMRRHAALDLCGKTSLGALAALVSRAALVVCNDTGISHLADALGIPSVVISTGRNPQRWSPANRRLHRVLCRPGGVTSDEVIAAAGDLRQWARRPRPAAATLNQEESSTFQELQCDPSAC